MRRRSSSSPRPPDHADPTAAAVGGRRGIGAARGGHAGHGGAHRGHRGHGRPGPREGPGHRRRPRRSRGRGRRGAGGGAGPMLAWVALAFSALLSVAVGNVVTFRAVRLLGPTRVTNYQFLSPVVAVVVGALLLSEVIVPGQIVGGAIIGAGILVARGDGRRLLVRAARSVSAG